jgi:hypothetical protein
MLELSTPNSIPNRIQPPPPPPIIIDEEPEYEISKILDSKLDKRWACKLLYLVQIPANELGHASEIVSEFHLCHPNKPGPFFHL